MQKRELRTRYYSKAQGSGKFSQFPRSCKTCNTAGKEAISTFRSDDNTSREVPSAFRLTSHQALIVAPTQSSKAQQTQHLKLPSLCIVPGLTSQARHFVRSVRPSISGVPSVLGSQPSPFDTEPLTCQAMHHLGGALVGLS
jgi:hypothetical protein